MSSRISLLFGAGFSQSMDMPSTWDITGKLLDGSDIVWDSENKEYFISFRDNIIENSYKSSYNKVIPDIINLLNRIKDFCDANYEREINYEDLYYVVSQMGEDLSGNYENPIIRPFFEEIGVRGISDLKIGDFLRRAKKYIEGVVISLLKSKIDSLKLQEFNFMKKIIEQYDVDIFTLNHDTVLEEWLKINIGDDFVDGFMKNTGEGMCFWAPETFSQCDKIKLVKLHGSVNWARYSTEERADIFAISTGSFKKYYFEERMILMGGHNKILDYTSSIFTTLYCYFWNRLQYTDVLVVSGYSFGDKGVNSRIIHWLNNFDSKMVVIHPDEDKLIYDESRDAIKNNWVGENGWRCNNKVVFIRSKIQEVNWEDLSNIIEREI